ncbi:MAG: Wzz/FepE/Etk N-terminal domain-containing protein [Syntrophobacteraceae bacterium]|jgi:uncharacterized protein involved in exopolysaccharide biosynthesis|nr:Wzz/FepE/Etk N-terminal domain-containing protein [Syntrophobacteraceae bacterium]
MESNQELTRIKNIVVRRRWWLIAPLAGTVLLTAVVAVLLPNTYKSTATILIQSQQIPSTLVPSTITSYAQQRIQSISQEVTSRSKLLTLSEKYSLLPDKREKLTTEEFVERIRKRIALQTINAEINPERGGQPIQMTIAFSLSYEDESPKTAQAVANEIASFFMEKNVESRTKHARGTTEFLQEQLKLEKENIDTLQGKLASYRRAHLEELPEYAALNMQKVDKLNTSISEINMQIRSLEEQRTALRGNLALLDPHSGGSRVMSPSDRLQQARIELTNLLSRYSEVHPAVLAKRQEIGLLETEGGVASSFSTEAAAQLADLEGRLAEQRAKYSEKHPTVQATLREIDRIQREAVRAPRAAQEKRGSAGTRPSNPAYVGLQADLDKVAVSVSSLKAEKSRLEAQMKELYQKLHAMPEVAKGFQDLDTEYQLARTHYAEIQQKLLAARVSQGMEEEQLGESFHVIEPAFLPEKPFKPNRVAILVVGVVVGCGFALGAAAARELSDRSIRDAETLESLTGLRVISTISPIVTEEDLRARRRRRWMTAATSACCVVGAVLAFHFLVMDLDVFYAKLERAMIRKIP